MTKRVKDILEDFCKKEGLDLNVEPEYDGFVDERKVHKGRSSKTCSICGCSIPTSESHYVETNQHFSYPMHKICRNIAIHLYEKYDKNEFKSYGIDDFFHNEEIEKLLTEIEDKVFDY